MKNILILIHFSDGSVLPIEESTGHGLIHALIGKQTAGTPPTRLEIEAISDDGEVWISIPNSKSEEVGFGAILKNDSEPICHYPPGEIHGMSMRALGQTLVKLIP